MLAVKGNREYTVSDVNQKIYQDSGYDIYGDDGKVIEYGAGKTVPYADYMKLQKENEELRAKLAEKGKSVQMPKKAGN